MKSFKQYITEDPVITTVPYEHEPNRYPVPVEVGRIGPYKIARAPEDPEEEYSESGVFHIFHKGKRIGYVPYAPHSHGAIQIEGPNIAESHRGRNAKVKDLMPKVYGFIADNLGKKIISDTAQSEGGKSIWDRLAAFRDVRIKRDASAFESPKLKGRYIPAEHEEHVFHPDYGHEFTLVLHPRKKSKA